MIFIFWLEKPKSAHLVPLFHGLFWLADRFSHPMLRFRSDQDATRAKTYVNERSTKHRLCVHPVAPVVVASLSGHRRLENEMEKWPD